MKCKKNRVFAFLLLLILLSVFAQFLAPAANAQQSSTVVDRAYWLRLANNAWKYYQPGVSVDSTTGLHAAGLAYPYFTDWDLGVYIQTIIDSNQLGILTSEGTWGANERLNKIVAFLQTRQLSPSGLPYIWYQAANGNPNVNNEQNAADTGQLLVSLNNLKVFRPDLASTINNIVYNRTNYTRLQQAIEGLANSKNLYDYYVVSGFAAFWPDRFSTLAETILNSIVAAPTVSTYGVALPTSKLACEPLLLSILNLDPNDKLLSLAQKVYLAHEARYNATGKFAAFSEGNTGLENPSYVYEWVIKEDGSTWTIDDESQKSTAISPIIYFKAAVGLQAIYNTPFTGLMTSFVESQLPNPSSGYSDGIDENGRINTFVIDKTNGMIIGAALYAVNNLPDPTPTPIVSSSPTDVTPPPTNPTIVPDSNPLESWFVIGFIVAVIIVGFSLFLISIVGALRKSPKQLY